jgi:hypothetical protein
MNPNLTTRQHYKATIMAAVISRLSEEDTKSLRNKPDVRKGFCADVGMLADAMIAEDEKHAAKATPAQPEASR